MLSAFGVDHGEFAKREAYQRRSVMDPVHPTHKQTTFTDPEGKTQNVDVKMKRTVEHLNRKGYKTYASDQGDFAVSRKGHWYKDAYVGFHDPGTKEKGKHPRGKALAAGLPKRFGVESNPPIRASKTGHFAGYSRGGSSVVRFPAGPGRGLVNRHRLRREVSRNDFSKAFKKLQPKLEAAESASVKRNPVGRSQSLNGRFRENYAQWRKSAGSAGSNRMFGKPGASRIDIARKDKEGARAMVTGIGNMTRRAGRVLP